MTRSYVFGLQWERDKRSGESIVCIGIWPAVISVKQGTIEHRFMDDAYNEIRRLEA